MQVYLLSGSCVLGDVFLFFNSKSYDMNMHCRLRDRDGQTMCFINIHFARAAWNLADPVGKCDCATVTTGTWAWEEKTRPLSSILSIYHQGTGLICDEATALLIRLSVILSPEPLS